MALVCCSVLVASCASSPDGRAGDGGSLARPEVVRTTRLSGDRVQLFFTPLAPVPAWETLSPEEARAVLAGFHQALRHMPAPRFQRALATEGGPAEWELRLRQEFLAKYGPSPLPLPGSLAHSRLYLALQRSPRYMGPGIRDAAEELFRSPAFLASVTLSVVVYLAAWALPEPVFSKAFAAALTVRLAIAVGLLELRNLGLACYQLYKDAEAARTVEELEAVAERFGRAMGGTALRAVVLVATFGVGKALPKVPEGGLWSLLTPSRYAMPGGLTWQSATTAQMVADGTLVVSGVAVGTAASTASGGAGSACTDGTVKKDGHQWHHLATNKNNSAEVRGGPWTPRFEELFARAGMSLEDPANLVYLKGHLGPHPEAYHAEIFDRLQTALGPCRTHDQCRGNLLRELRRVADELCTHGSSLHQLVTR
ncbi:AHH domain-containing protein [Pyxidicoccus sp. MSG2]|uniref:AHH domain-containing protein n=1 Tax=Pyxidicoccus sp. MSG2 TaxID=2996790 RepID=UPI00226E6ACF|nr:AHH domain-containing protein [Pyxidicoccus sp. MSG2]MCY1018307.1 AHH domain-containing protein [Pyxidicoccus sp. MSG2]